MFKKFLAVLEVIFVAFFLLPYLTLGLYRLFPSLETWQTERLGFPFPVLFYVIGVAVVLLIIFIRREKVAGYGIHFHNVKYQLDIALTCFLPVVLCDMVLGVGLDYKSWSGALVLAVIQAALLFALAWLLRKKPAAQVSGLFGVGFVFMPVLAHGVGSIVGKAVAVFLTYALFVGFGEEILYRGYMQGRLNDVFGKPFRFFGVSYGWGAIITSILFGLTHVGFQRFILGVSPQLTLAWGFWTIFSGLVFGFVREKTGSVFPGAFLHGLPQAIASVGMLFL